MTHAAAVVILLTGLVHSVAGELLIMRHLPRMTGFPIALGNDLLAKRTVHFTWHLATIFAWAFALLAWHSTDRFVLDVLAGALAAAAALTCALSRAIHPGWLALGGAATLLALR